jgi:hypothetical protein
MKHKIPLRVGSRQNQPKPVWFRYRVHSRGKAEKAAHFSERPGSEISSKEKGRQSDGPQVCCDFFGA